MAPKKTPGASDPKGKGKGKGADDDDLVEIEVEYGFAGEKIKCVYVCDPLPAPSAAVHPRLHVPKACH